MNREIRKKHEKGEKYLAFLAPFAVEIKGTTNGHR